MEPYSFKCVDCQKTFKITKAHRGRKRTRCSSCRGEIKSAKESSPTHITFTCRACRGEVTVQKRRGRPPTVCSDCRGNKAIAGPVKEPQREINPLKVDFYYRRRMQFLIDKYRTVWDIPSIAIQKANEEHRRAWCIALGRDYGMGSPVSNKWPEIEALLKEQFQGDRA